MNSHSTQILKVQEEIKNKLISGIPTKVQIPNWDPVGLEEGFKWIEATINEGYHLKFVINSENGLNLVTLLKWEFGENEPNF